jgi:hypothetical protein
MSTTLRIASIVYVLCTIIAAFFAFANAYAGDYIGATVCLALCGLSVVLWRMAGAVQDEYYRGTK